MINKFLYNVFLLQLLCFFGSYSQNAQDGFGKNRIQYQDFQWSVISTDNFDIYYYPQSKNIAVLAANYAENEFERIADFLSYAPYGRIKLVVYATHSDLLQSNIGLTTQTVFIGGYTVFLKNKIEVAFNGMQTDLQKEISRGITQLILNEMMYGSGVREVIQSTYFLSLPEWFLSGLVEYCSSGWSVQADDKIRDMFLTKKFKKPNRFTGEDATIIGLSIWNYLLEQYGSASVQNVLMETKSLRNAEKGIAQVVNKPYKEFLKDWKSFYISHLATVKDSLNTPENTIKIIKNTREETYYGSLKLSPDGTRLAYVQNRKGRYKVYVKNIETGKRYNVYRGGYKTFDQKVNYDLPVVTWRNNDKVGIVIVRHDKLRLITYDIKKEFASTRERVNVELSNLFYRIYTKKQTYRGIYKHFRQVNDFNFNADGSQIVLSGENFLGQSDIFMYNLRNNNITPITNDVFDDRYPFFLPNSTKEVIFSSNRTTDSLQPKQKLDFRQMQYKHDLFYYHSDSSLVKSKRITNTPKYDEVMPKLTKNGTIYYLSDVNGVFELYKMDGINSKPQSLTKFRQSILSYDVNDTQTNLVYVMNMNGKRKFFLDTAFNPQKVYDTLPKTYRQQMFDNLVYDYKTARQLAPVIAKSQPVITRYELSMARKNRTNPTDTIEIDINNYVFEFEKTEAKLKNTALVPNPTDTAQSSRKTKKRIIDVKLRYNELYISSPVRYKNDFGLDNITSALRIDPLRGSGLEAVARMSDIMANHRINAGLFGVFDFRTSIMWLEYEYLKKRFDYKIRYTKDALYWNPADIVHRYRLQKWEFTTAYPINPMLRASVTPSYSHMRFNNLTIFQLPLGLATPDVITHYIGINGELNFDNVRSRGINMNEGTRAKAGLTLQYATNASRKNFGKWYIDVRNYTRLHKDLTWANRGSAGAFVGPGRKNFLIGGMDSWLFNRTNTEDPNNPLITRAQQDNSDLLFNEYVTNLRGFPYSQLFGNNYVLWNTELRLPVFKYLIRRHIKSNFIRNFQITGFYDVGTAWSGRSPFSRDNSLNRRFIGGQAGNPFSADVINYKNPFLQGYGFGARSLIQGYYTKLDVAWGEIDFVRQRVFFYLTIGNDF